MASATSDWQNFSSKGERAGLALVATAGLASALSTSALISYIIWVTFITHDKSKPLPSGVRKFTRSSLGCYLISLLFCDFFQGVAFTINYRWSALGFMSHSKFCTVQGAVSEIGDLGAAIWSMAITYHTFWVLFMVRKPHYLVAPVILVGGWALLIFLPLVGFYLIQTPSRGPFYGLSGAWCWIGQNYGAERVIYLYAWIFAALGSSCVIYTLIYLRFSNNITCDQNGKFKLHFRCPEQHSSSNGNKPTAPKAHRSLRSPSSLTGCFNWGRKMRDNGYVSGGTDRNDQRSDGSQPNIGSDLKRIARRLMWYPILYAVVVLPASVCRMGVLAGWQPPFWLFVCAGILFGGSGVSNCILFVMTRHGFIKQVVNVNATRVRITTQRITVREGWKRGEQIELDELKGDSDGASFRPGVLKSVPPEYFGSVEAMYHGNGKDRVSNLEHGHGQGEDTERHPGINITVLG